MAVQEAQGEPKLKRAAGLTQITLFGLGSMAVPSGLPFSFRWWQHF
ncbi:hypothetical protein LUX29_09530 [Aureimonas altamirensis]|nr:hypothetical protein [Aureimonas altamirensis]UHD47383.1 hypothetical protein LUX29_09530 [Aureimonas altamirensis]